jgi:hypothetical protein
MRECLLLPGAEAAEAAAGGGGGGGGGEQEQLRALGANERLNRWMGASYM